MLTEPILSHESEYPFPVVPTVLKLAGQGTSDSADSRARRSSVDCLYGHVEQAARLKSRKSFLRTTHQLNLTPKERRLELWNQQVQQPLLELKEELPTGSSQPFLTWKALNRLRSGVSCCKYNKKLWGYEEDATCGCGSEQTHEHLLVCGQMETTCTHADLLAANERAIYVSNYWGRKI
ncbi:hypothetical protein M8J77_006388 [Diaphorina citri]|nr:hypothetical protein M8J77_006388 [Diaphorina citri]